jgi:endonuclease YncB( thermonuclease family)
MIKNGYARCITGHHNVKYQKIFIHGSRKLLPSKNHKGLWAVSPTPGKRRPQRQPKPSTGNTGNAHAQRPKE